GSDQQGPETGAAVAVSSTGFVYVTGWTTETNFPVKNAYQSTSGGPSLSPYDAFLTVINPTPSPPVVIPGDSLTGWTFTERGGSPSGKGSATVASGSITIHEGDSFDAFLSRTVTIPDDPT